MNPRRIVIIGNPSAGGGRGKQVISAVKSLLRPNAGESCTFLETTRSGEAILLARGLSAQPPDLLLAIGGDGTVHEVINGLLDGHQGPMADVPVGLINCGSGGGLAQSLGLPAALPDQVARALHASPRRVDLGRVTCLGPDGRSIDRYFISECQAGISGEIVVHTGKRKKHLGGHWAYALTSIGQLLRYRSSRMTIRTDDDPAHAGTMLGVVVGNGRYTAGGMQLTPGAILDDGYLDALLIDEMGLYDRFTTFAKVFSGTHIHTPHYSLRRIRTLHLESVPPVWVEADGEVLGHTPCSIRVIPAAIRVCY